MGNTAPRMDGEWIERSGRIWRATQSGNTFKWVQDGTNRNASGIAVPLNGGLQWILFATFDGHSNMKFVPSVDGSQLIANNETFTRIHSMNYTTSISQPASTLINDIPSVVGVDFAENSGKIWKCTMHEGGHLILKNQTDGRICDTYAVRDANRNVLVLYLVFQNHQTSSEQILKVETTMDMNMWQLPNGDCFRRVGGGGSSLVGMGLGGQQQQPPMYQQSMYPTAPPHPQQPYLVPPYQVPPPMEQPQQQQYQPNIPTSTYQPYGQPTPNMSYQGYSPQQQPYGQPSSSMQSSIYQQQQPPIYQQPPMYQPIIQQPPIVVQQQQPVVIQQQPITQQPIQQTRYYRIGGGKDGITTWTRWNGAACNTSVEGWEMVFQVDQNGNVSGSNRNDTKGSVTKHYSGIFRNNMMDVAAVWDDGRIATYKGTVNGNRVRLDYVITAIGNQGGKVGDCGVNNGTLFETNSSPSVSRSFNISGKTFWTKWNGALCNSEVDGWKMTFNVDKFGNVSGQNKNAGQSQSKTYTGTFLNNVMDVTARWDDGRVATYKGTLNGKNVRLDFVITNVGTQSGRNGDCGFNMGTVEIV